MYKASSSSESTDSTDSTSADGAKSDIKDADFEVVDEQDEK